MALKDKIFLTKITEDRYYIQTRKESKWRASITIKFSIFFLTAVIISLFFALHINEKQINTIDLSITPGTIWSNPTIKADYSYPIYKEKKQYLKEVNDAKLKSLDVFRSNANAINEATSKLDELIDLLLNSPDLLSDEIIDNFSETALNPLMNNNVQVKKDVLNSINKEIRFILSKAYKKGYVNIDIDQIKTLDIIVINNTFDEVRLKKNNVYDSGILLNEAKQIFKNRIPTKAHTLAVELLDKVVKPNLTYSQDLTDKKREIAEQSVPKTIGIVRKGEVVIAKSERITEENFLKIQSYKNTSFLKKDTLNSVWVYLGSFGHASILLSIMFIYLYQIRKKIFADNVQISILSSVLILLSFFSWLSIEIPSTLPIEFLVILPSLSMLVAIVFDSRTAFYVTVTMALMLAGIRGNDYTNAVIMLLAGTLAAYTVRDIRNRTQIYKSIFYIFIGFTLPIFAFGLERSNDIMTILTKLSFATVNAAVAPLVTFGLLILLERIANIGTDLRFQEYDNLSHPLLQRMQEQSPGTYQHTLGVAFLTEKCAMAIGANELLTKVGTYFHDIGKMLSPDYFVENQKEDENRHDYITPYQSAIAIKEHVTKGIELAKEYKLPEEIIDLIPMHHGTTLIKHFYAKALEEANGAKIDKSDFRYAGPKPRSREAAIVMICDTAEAISRIEGKTLDDIDAMILELIKERALDGQFDECDITLMDLNIIRETITKNLVGKQHKRVQYKEIPKDNE